MNKTSIGLPLIAMLLAVGGCGSTEDTDSTNVTNQGLYAKFVATEEDTGNTRLVAEINVGGKNGTNVELVDGEYIDVSVNGITRELERDVDFLDIDYQLYIDVGTDEAEFVFNLYRNDQSDILNSRLTLAAGFDITLPERNDTLFSSVPTVITWTPDDPDHSIKVLTTLTCVSLGGGQVIDSEETTISDDGYFEILFDNRLENMQGVNRDENCEVDFRFTRQRSGSLSDGFGEGGSMKSYRIRTLKNLTLVVQ